MSQPGKNPEPQRSFPGDPEQEESPPQGQDELLFHALHVLHRARAGDRGLGADPALCTSHHPANP